MTRPPILPGTILLDGSGCRWLVAAVINDDGERRYMLHPDDFMESAALWPADVVEAMEVAA